MSALFPRDTPADVVSTREGYDRWAALYDDQVNALCLLEEREIETLLGPVASLEIADVGCGTGRHAVPLAAAGARVTGIDFSQGMLAKARAKPGADRVRFVEHDLRRPLPFADGTFDRVISCLMLDHVSWLPAFFGELGRVCRPDGFVLCTAMHPAMMLRGVQAHFTDPATGRDVLPESAPNQIADYVMGAVQAGLRIELVAERSVDRELVGACPRIEKYLGWPLLFMMKLRR